MSMSIINNQSVIQANQGLQKQGNLSLNSPDIRKNAQVNAVTAGKTEPKIDLPNEKPVIQKPVITDMMRSHLDVTLTRPRELFYTNYTNNPTGNSGGSSFSGGASTTGLIDYEGGVNVDSGSQKDENGTTSYVSVTDKNGNNITKTTKTDKDGNSTSKTVKKDAKGNVVGTSTMGSDIPGDNSGDGDSGFFGPENGFIPGRGPVGSSGDKSTAPTRRIPRPGDAWIDPPRVILGIGNNLATHAAYLDSAAQKIKSDVSTGAENSKEAGRTLDLNNTAKSSGNMGAGNQPLVDGNSVNNMARVQDTVGRISNSANAVSVAQRGTYINTFG